MDPDQRKWSILNTQTGELNTPNYDGKAAGGVNTAFCIYNNDLYTFIGQKYIVSITQRMNLSFVSHCPTRMEIFVCTGIHGEVMDIRQQFWII